MTRRIVKGSIDHEFHVVRRLGDDGGGMNQGIAIVERKRDRRLLMRKTFRQTEDERSGARNWHREMKLLATLDHSNICRFVDGSINSTMGRLYMEFCDLGNLSDLKDNMNQLQMDVPESFVWHVLRSLTDALCHIHRGFLDSDEVRASEYGDVQGWVCILHRDIKCNNVFLKPGASGAYPQVKLGDFGLAVSEAELEQQPSGVQIGGARGWTAPEFPNCSERSDIFGVGAVIQYLCKYSSWRGVEPEAGVSEGYSDTLHDLVGTMMARRSEMRPSSVDLVKAIDKRLRWLKLPYKSMPRQAYARLLE